MGPDPLEVGILVVAMSFLPFDFCFSLAHYMITTVNIFSTLVYNFHEHKMLKYFTSTFFYLHSSILSFYFVQNTSWVHESRTCSLQANYTFNLSQDQRQRIELKTVVCLPCVRCSAITLNFLKQWISFHDWPQIKLIWEKICIFSISMTILT